MKAPTITKKWILTASLLTVLGAHYSYQTSSISISKAYAQKNSGEYVLASTEDKPATKTESTVTEPAACTDGCETPSTASVIKPEDFAKLLTRIEALEKSQAPTSTPAPDHRERDSDCEEASADETRDEKRKRIKCEKEEKEKIKKDELKTKFEDRVEDLKDKCDQDLECLASGFTSILSRFEGKSSLPATLVANSFRSTVGTALSKALYTADSEGLEATLAALQSLMQDMPEQYKALRQSVMNTISTKAKTASSKVAAKVAQLNALAQQNNPQAYFEAYNAATKEYQDMVYLTNSYSGSVEQSIEMSGDTAALSYYQRSYVPDMQKIIASITNPTTAATTTTNGSGRDTRVQTSGTNQTTVTTTIPQIPQVDGKITPGWLLPTSNTGVQFGTTTTTPTGTRTGRQPLQ